MAKYMALMVALLAISVSEAAIAGDAVTSFPGTNTTDWGFDIYSGILKLPYTGGRGIHYVFATSQSSTPTTDPVVLWLTGGPGCSSLNAFVYENGPYVFPANMTYLEKNDWAWNNHANMLWFESPAGVGFSPVGSANNSNTNDVQTTTDALNALNLWFDGFSEYRPNDFYVTGESYGGVYVPYLTSYIQTYNNQTTTTNKINLKGMTVGNGLTNTTADLGTETYADFLWWHALYGQTTRDNYEQYCIGAEPDAMKCNDALEVMSNSTL